MMQPLNTVRMGEEVVTFSTLLEESYTPSREKPWQGIWVGDYSGHGCEFLLVLQHEVTSPMTLSRKSSTGSIPGGMTMARADANVGLQDSDPTLQLAGAAESQNLVPGDDVAEIAGHDPAARDAQASSTEAPSGRLEAIKLTGDVNVPRGEYTWIAEDIGPKGLIRVANEQMFFGARTVRSWGHIAGRGYRHDRFISSQLIMISHDSLAQYWEVSQVYL